ncbi:unnamed protein product [Rhizophagus irregularis]|nr:unnamed protein product [Rhizophagus irregularis]
MNVQVTSDDINILIYKYLHESGFNFSPAVFNMEAKVEEAAHRKGIAEKDCRNWTTCKDHIQRSFFIWTWNCTHYRMNLRLNVVLLYI